MVPRSIPVLNRAATVVQREQDFSISLAQGLEGVMARIIDEWPQTGEYWESGATGNPNDSKYHGHVVLC